MYSTKSFCNIVAFASQEPGVVSPIGELTTYAKTFTKDLAFYRHTTLERYELLNFKSVKDSTTIQVPQVNVDKAISFVDALTRLTQATSGELYYDEVLIQLKTLAGLNNAINVNMGVMVNAGAWWMPEWISWTDSNDPDSNNTHKVWLSLSAFVNQYTDYEIVVVPPIDGLDQFFNPGDRVIELINSITLSQMMERAEVAKDGYPETIIRSDPYEYNDPINPLRKKDVYWSVLIYGQAGNDPDLIRNALVDYILAHSTHSKADWTVIFPDIFKRNEIIFAPLWNNYAIEKRIFAEGIYSPIVDVQSPVEWLKQHITDYSPDHIASNAQTFGFPYRSLEIASIGSIENIAGRVKISDLYPDYINVDTSSTDAARMSTATLEWSIAMAKLVLLAETVLPTTDLPQGIYRVTRGNRYYTAMTINRVLMLVLAKNSIPIVQEG